LDSTVNGSIGDLDVEAMLLPTAAHDWAASTSAPAS
jgi:hypothetical protein